MSALIAVALVAGLQPQANATTWSENVVAEPARISATAVTAGTSAYIIGGDVCCYRLSSGANVVVDSSDIIRYNRQTGKMTKVASLPYGRTRAAAAWDGSNIYVFGGTHLEVVPSRTEPDPDSTYGGGPGEFVYRFTSKKIFRFNPSTGAVTTLTSPLGAIQPFAAIWDGSNIYLFLLERGSSPGSFEIRERLRIVRYNPAQHTQTVVYDGRARNEVFQGFAAAWTGTVFTIFGDRIRDANGQLLTDGNGAPYPTILRFDPRTNQLTEPGARLPALAGDRNRLGSALWDGTNVYVVSDDSNILRYSPATNTVTDLQENPGVKASAAVWMNNSAYLFNGGSLNRDKPDVLVWSPSRPSEPRSLSAAPQAGSIRLNWFSPSAGPVTGYRILRSYVRESAKYGEISMLSTIATVGANTTTYVDTEIDDGRTYYYNVYAQNSFGEGPASNEASGRATLSAPQDFWVQSPGSGKIHLSWCPPAFTGGSAITGYTLYRGTAHGNEGTPIDVGNSLSYTDQGLSNDIEYFYFVNARTANNSGGPTSDEGSAIPGSLPPVDPSPPSTPACFSVRAGNQAAHLLWQLHASNNGSTVTSFKIYRGTTAENLQLIATLGAGTASFTDTNLANGSSYFYAIAAENSQGEGRRSAAAIVVPEPGPTRPSPVENLAAFPRSGNVTLDWDGPAFDGGAPITGYRIFRGTSPDNLSNYGVFGTETSYIDYGAFDGNTYYYRVTALNAIGQSDLSDLVAAAPLGPPAPPAPPDDIEVVGGPGAVKISWREPYWNGGSPITAVNVYRGVTSSQLVLMATTPATTWSYIDTSVMNGTEYYYSVRTVNALGESISSVVGRVKPFGVPSAPQNLAVTPGDRLNSLSWQRAASDGGSAITSQEVVRSLANGTQATVVTVGAGQTSYTDSGLTNGTTYLYRVRAVNAAGTGPSSAEVSAIPRGKPLAPVLTSLTPGPHSVRLDWQAANANGSAVTGYRIYRGTTPSSASFVGSTDASTLRYSEAYLTNGTRYYYVVTALNAVGESPASNQLSTIPAGPPSAPTNVVATAQYRAIKLTWDPPADNGGLPITSYTIYRGTDETSGSVVATTDANGRAFTDTNVVMGTTYYYFMAAANERLPGFRSMPPASATVRADTVTPSSRVTTAGGSVLFSLPMLTTPVTGTASDDFSGIEKVRVSFISTLALTNSTFDAALICNSERTACSWEASPPLVPGIYMFSAQAVDREGNQEPGSSPLTFIVL